MTAVHASILTGVLLVGFQGPQPWQHHGPTEAEKEASRIKIGITKAQQQKIEAIFAESGKQEQEVRKKMRELYGEVYGKVYRNYDYDRQREEALHREIIDLYRQRMRIQSNRQVQLRKVLTREQFDRMIAMMDEKRKEWEAHRAKMGGPGGRGGPGGPHGGPGGGFPGPGRQGGQFPAPGGPGGI